MAAAARRDNAREALRLLREGTRPERIAAARGEVANAGAALAAALQTAADLVLQSPVSGTVMLRSAEPGEVVAGGVGVQGARRNLPGNAASISGVTVKPSIALSIR